MFPPSPQAFTEAFWRGQQRRFALALHDGFIYFWEPDSEEFQREPHEWVWAVEGNIVGARHGQPNSGFLICVLQGALQNRKVGRLIRWESDKFVFLHPSGVGSISRKWVENRMLDVGAFRFQDGSGMFTRTASDYLEQLRTLFKQPTSDFAFSLRWAKMSVTENAWQLVQLGRGDWDEMHTVAQRILMLEGHNFHELGLGLEDTIIVRFQCYDWQFSLCVCSEDEEFSTKRQELWDEFLRFFCLNLNDEVIERYTAANQAVMNGFSWEDFRLSRRLSQHEYMETLLLLRDWLRDRVGLSGERIAELLA